MSANAAESNLTQALANQSAASAEKIPQEAQNVMNNATESLATEKIIDEVIKVGAKLPDSQLINPQGELVNLYESIGEGPAVITFYRGGWCPYCNLQLRYYQQALPEFQKKGAKLVAITPETPDNSLSTSEKNELEFTVLSDKDNSFARELGLVFTLPPDLVEVYSNFGIDLKKANGSDKWELPLAASFVVNKNKEVVYRFVDVDYKKRASVEELLAALK